MVQYYPLFHGERDCTFKPTHVTAQHEDFTKLLWQI